MSKAPIDPALRGSKFALVNNVCRRCGKPTNTISLTCHECLKQISLPQQMEHAKELLRARPRQAIELGRSRDRVVHLAQFDMPNVGWCWAQLTEARSKRRRVPAANFPAELCQACRDLYRGVASCL